MDTLLVIDAYLSKEERFLVCKDLIESLRNVFPEHKILLINKYKDSWDLEKAVDYYYGCKGFLVGPPPEDILSSGKYERPYTYMTMDIGTFENWYPLVNVSDHVADVYNSFIIASNVAEMLGFQKVFKVEYDTCFNEEDLTRIKQDVDSFEDYLLYGIRKEGKWAQDHQYLLDVHIIGFSPRIFKDFNVVQQDKDFWDLCSKINYYGKWVEYVIPAIIEYTRKETPLNGIVYQNRVKEMYPRTLFDSINSPGIWATTWDEIPKVCRVSTTSGNEHARPNELVIFYTSNRAYNSGITVHTYCKITNDKTGEVIYEKELKLNPGTWVFDHIYVYDPVTAYVKTDQGYEKETQYHPDMIDKIDPRFVFNR